MLRLALLVALVSTATAAAAPPRASVTSRGHVTVFSLSAADAGRLAAVCAAEGASACGDLLTRGDGPQLAADCGRTGAELARMLRRAAREAAARDARVELRTENGGYPYVCRFDVRDAALDSLCATRRISQPELDALPLFERIFALVRHGFCVGPGWAPDLPAAP